MIQRGVSENTIKEALTKCEFLPVYDVLIILPDPILVEDYKTIVKKELLNYNYLQAKTGFGWMEIIFPNNSCCRIHYPSTARGFRAHDLYYSRNIEKSIIEEVLLPLVKLPYDKSYINMFKEKNNKETN